GFYSGFTFKPEVAFDKIDLDSSTCIPNITLSVNPITAFDVFQWYFNDNPIAGATSRNYVPTVPGYYHVSATISDCGTTLISDRIPVSSCPADSDNDLCVDNLDLDYDNDGITNCDESYGNLPLDLSNLAGGTMTLNDYNNSFTGSFPAGTGPQAAVPLTGFANGSLVTEVMPGKGNSVSYTATFAQPVNISVDYPLTGNSGDEMTSES